MALLAGGAVQVGEPNAAEDSMNAVNDIVEDTSAVAETDDDPWVDAENKEVSDVTTRSDDCCN
jgi:hypothetical protein